MDKKSKQSGKDLSSSRKGVHASLPALMRLQENEKDLSSLRNSGQQVFHTSSQMSLRRALVPVHPPPHRRPEFLNTSTPSSPRPMETTQTPLSLRGTSNVPRSAIPKTSIQKEQADFNMSSLKRNPTTATASSRAIGTPGSDDSDENLLQNRGGRLRYDSKKLETHKQTAHRTPGPVSNSAKDVPTPGKSEKKDSHGSNAAGVSLKNACITNKLPSKSRSPTQEKSRDDEHASHGTMDELKRLRRQIVAQAHMNHLKDLSYPTANPEILVKCREGPGTDPESDIYKQIAKSRLPGKEDVSDSSDTSRTLYVPPASQTEPQRPKNYSAQKELYSKSSPLFPIIVDGNIVLSPKPTSKQRETLERNRGSRSEVHPSQNGLLEEVTTQDGIHEFVPDWDFRPRVCPNFEVVRHSFHLWLKNTATLPYNVDIYHQTFFDGTAHANGKRSFFIPDQDVDETQLDLNDEESRLHVHENAEGYCHNLGLHIKKADEKKESRKKEIREIYFQASQSPRLPSSPSAKANIYLRPVLPVDIPDLVRICSWYAKNSTISLNIETLDAEDLRLRIEECNEEELPFLVAVDRRVGATEKILGYAFATDFEGPHSAGRFTAELEVFVKDGHKRQGIGKCLMDKLIEVCDPTYKPKSGYIFEANSGEGSRYYPGGRRRLGRLVFTLGYSDGDCSSYQWTKDWLEREYNFEEQGLLKGTRFKFGKFLNVSYLVRNVDHVNAGVWQG